MELNKTYCQDCGHLNRWYSYKWANTEDRQDHNRRNDTTCPKCGSHNVKNVEDDETMGPYRAVVSALVGGRRGPK
jgi:Zn finger protein HypA/HybF involved in hydrogenase expression